MSSTALTFAISPSTDHRENATVRLTSHLRTPRAHLKLLDCNRRPLPKKSKGPTSLQFLTITENPEVERKSNAHRRTVRSNAIKHAIQEKRRSTNTALRHPHADTTSEHPLSSPLGEDAGSQTSNDSRDASATLPECSLPVARTSSPHFLWPLGTVAAKTNLSELDIVSYHFEKVKSQCSVFSHLIDTPDDNRDLASVVLHSPVIYHATLYVADVQQSACTRSAWAANGTRGPLFHEGIVLRYVQNAISTSILPSEEVIFATALLGIAQLIFEGSQSGAMHLEGVAQMVRLRGGVHRLTMPFLFSLLEWSVSPVAAPLLEAAYHARLVGTHTLNLAADVGYGDTLQPPFNIRPQLPYHSPDESMRPSDGMSFTFLSRRRVLYKEVAHNLEKLTKSHNVSSRNKVQARCGMLALTDWHPSDGGAVHNHIPQMDEAARLAGLLSYRLVYDGGYHDLISELMVTRLRDECSKIYGEKHILGLLYNPCSDRLCLLLWSLYCGGVFATNEVRAWFVERIRVVAGSTGKDWPRTRNILDKFVWDDETCEGPMKQLWRESLVTEEVTAVYQV
ncbi:MAG: hypothetical protein LQ344_001069 [Seirophora lacunosa]|nr:MAG: hypothetical protein LQ344_001069 [Seirophora lacunosa]